MTSGFNASSPLASFSNNLPIDYNQLANLNNSNLGLYNGSNFDLLLSSGTLNPANASSLSTGLNAGNTGSASLPGLLSAGASQLTSKLLQRNPTSPQSYAHTSPYNSSILSSQLPMSDILSSIAANTLPLLKTKGTLGAFVQNVPQLFQLITGSITAINLWSDLQGQPVHKLQISKEAQSGIQFDEDLMQYS